MELFGRELSIEQVIGLVECNASPDEDLVHRAALELIAALRVAQRREGAAVEMLIKFIKQSDGTCDYCKNHIECAGEQCDEFEEGVGGTGNDGTEFPDWHWQCTDFDYGTCAMLVNTPCNGCFENDCSGFEWRGPQEAREGE